MQRNNGEMLKRKSAAKAKKSAKWRLAISKNNRNGGMAASGIGVSIESEENMA